MSARKAHTPDTGKRDAILRAALSLFSERGFHGTAMPLLAERAGVGAGTLYRYFASKEALVNALYKEWKGRMMGMLMERFPFDAPPRRQFHELWSRLGRFIKAHPEGFAFLELHHHAPYLDEESQQLEQSSLEVFVGFVRKAQEMQVMKPCDPALLIALIYGAFVGVAKGCALGHLKPSRELMEQAEQLMWEAIRV